MTAGIWMALAGCASQMLHRDGMELVRNGQLEEGVRLLSQALQEEPDNVAFRQDWLTARTAVIQRLLADARRQHAQGDGTAAENTLLRIVAIDPANSAGQNALTALRRAKLHDGWLVEARQLAEAGAMARALQLLQAILASDSGHDGARRLLDEIESEQLRAHFQEASMRETYPLPVHLEFRDANVRMVLEALSRTTGINFIFDKDIPTDLRTTVFLRDAKVDEALDLILRNSQLRLKVLNSKTVQVYPDTPEKRRDYQELVVRAFYLQDASAAQIQTVLKTLLRMKDIVIDERLNLVTVRDTPEAVRLAERLVALHDLAEPEVMLELEVLEVQRDDLLKAGFQWPNQLSVLPLARGGLLTVDDLRHLNGSSLGVSFTNPSVTLRQDHGVSNLLANPRIRVHNREKASVLIGDKVPVITTTSNATGFVTENVQYLDVGLKLAAEPLIHQSNDVSLRLNLEVSSIAGQVSTPNGTVAYQVGTRNAATFLRLQDGETQVLAGLISDQDRQSASGVPGLSRLPLLGRLFSAPSDSRSKTEIVLSVTPHVVRGAGRAAQAREFWSGTESTMNTRPLRLSESGPATPPQANSMNASAAVVPPTPATPPQLIWNGPNQVATGEEFTLSVRIKAANTNVPSMRILYDSSALDVTEVVSGEMVRTKGNIRHDNEQAFVEVDLRDSIPSGAALDGTLLSLRIKARGTHTATALRIISTGTTAAEIAAPYTVTIAP
jgi:general secretion pathway protein D